MLVAYPLRLFVACPTEPQTCVFFVGRCCFWELWGIPLHVQMPELDLFCLCRRALATPWCALQNIDLIDPEKCIIINKASDGHTFGFCSRCRSLKPSQYRNDNHIYGTQCRVAAMSFWLQVVYTLLSLTPPDMWGFIVNCTSQAGIPSESITVDSKKPHHLFVEFHQPPVYILCGC